MCLNKMWVRRVAWIRQKETHRRMYCYIDEAILLRMVSSSWIMFVMEWVDLPKWAIWSSTGWMKYTNAGVNILKRKPTNQSAWRHRTSEQKLFSGHKIVNIVSFQTGKRCRNHHRTVQFCHPDSTSHSHWTGPFGKNQLTFCALLALFAWSWPLPAFSAAGWGLAFSLLVTWAFSWDCSAGLSLFTAGVSFGAYASPLIGLYPTGMKEKSSENSPREKILIAFYSRQNPN